MNISFSYRIAIKYFLAKKNETLVSFISGFSMLGVMIGVASLIVVMSVMNGFHLELTKNILGLNSDIVIRPYDSYFSTADELLVKIRKFPFVKQVNSVVDGQALAIGSRASSGVVIRGMSVQDLKLKSQIVDNIILGDLTEFSKNNKLILGNELAKILGVRVGDEVKLVSPNTITSVLGILPRVKDFEVAAIFNSNLYDYDAAVIIMNINSAASFLSLAGKVNMFEVYSINPDMALSFAIEIQSKLERHAMVSSWQSSHDQILNALKVERVAMFTILSLIIVVACFNIISSLFMLVKDKTRDIAILRTIGASKYDIMLIFMINGLIIGIIGTYLGLILGLGFAFNIDSIRHFLEDMVGVKIFEPAVYLLSNLPSRIIWLDIVKIVSFSLGTSLIATIYPAYKAATINPVEAMRYE